MRECRVKAEALRCAMNQAMRENRRSLDGEALQQLVFYGIASRSTARGDPQLAVDRAHMRIDSDQADDEPLGHLRAGQALGEQAQHVHLTRRQVVGRG